jgi:tetratricopeptide (TPR) repeat protein
MSGMVLWRLEINHLAYTQWVDAIKGFSKLAEDVGEAGQTDKAKWYRDLLDTLKAELACMPEEAYSWLTEQSGGQLNGEIFRLRDRAFSLVKSRDRRRADDAIRQLLEVANIRPAGPEKAQAYLESGLAKHQLGQAGEAIYYLKMALSLYMPRTYQYAVASWMLGTLEWQDGQEAQAYYHWQRGIETVSELAEKAGAARVDKDRKRGDFLKEKRDLMKRAKNRLSAR